MRKALVISIVVFLLAIVFLSPILVSAQPQILYWKPSYQEYAPSGMPDFDQKQDAWNPTGKFTWCAPTAVANSLWWLDSEFHSSNLVTTYPGAISEHDPSNVMPLIQDLAWLMDTDGIRTGLGGHVGTRTVDIQNGTNWYLANHGVSNQFYVQLVNFPNFTYVEQEVERCEDVVLCLGFYNNITGQRLNYPYEYGIGHCVTVAGVNSTTMKIAISDPDNDAFHDGLITQGRVPVPHPPYPHNSSIHNNASLVSQDIYNVTFTPPPPGLPVGAWALKGYTVTGAIPGSIAVVEAAVITSPHPPPQLYWKPSYQEYAPSGMPDFNQKQDAWQKNMKWSWCAPVAVANSLWWLDSEFHPSNLVTTYLGAVSEHDPTNVPFLIQNLATLMGTDAGGQWGTLTVNIGPGIQAYLVQQGVSNQFTVTTWMAPDFYAVEEEVEKCEDVVLALGLWTFSGGVWTRETYPYPNGVGHCVTVAGINSTTLQIGISDPYNDTAEYGLPGVVIPPTPHNHPAPPDTIHNNASFISHDIYNVTLLPPGSPGKWALVNYAFPQLPGPPPANSFVIVEAAVITSPRAVGGVWVPVDKLGLLAPYIALTSTILAATFAAAIYVKRNKSRKKQ